MKNLAEKIGPWMERNLEDPLFRAEMARAVPSKDKDGVSTAVQISVAAVLVIMTCWLFLSAF
ncbi:MAG: hypothetical protein K6T66_02840 [Peptococcaceae bacterium]|nr:hypothetical protein [Peptococcaceae bacterium]